MLRRVGSSGWSKWSKHGLFCASLFPLSINITAFASTHFQLIFNCTMPQRYEDKAYREAVRDVDLDPELPDEAVNVTFPLDDGTKVTYRVPLSNETNRMNEEVWNALEGGNPENLDMATVTSIFLQARSRVAEEDKTFVESLHASQTNTDGTATPGTKNEGCQQSSVSKSTGKPSKAEGSKARVSLRSRLMSRFERLG
jgi:hypothetical protein